MLDTEASRVSFPMAEALAFGTLALRRAGVHESLGLLAEERAPEKRGHGALAGLNLGSYSVRLSGQDVERGTFNQRHAVVYDQVTGERLLRLNRLEPGRQEVVEIWNSPLSEAAVLGFEYGYSLGCAGRALVVWEAQFGDFANNAQVMIDQFIAAAEERWGQESALVLSLPHGYDGNGPDHSSARVERFLSLCNDDPDHLPGQSPHQLKEMSRTFEAVASQHGGSLTRQQVEGMLRAGGFATNGETMDVLWAELGLEPLAKITLDVWHGIMGQYMRRQYERQANMFVVNCTTPAQLFHVLRRQVNRPYVKPLVLLAPKFLLHHRTATSPLSDFTTSYFFNRVIDDSKRSDNTRHLALNPKTGKPHLLPAGEIQRIILCSGQIYYHLSAARRSRRIRSIVLVRLEQIAPFPFDLMAKVVAQYTAAEVVWCQEEPKNMGCWPYVRPRLITAIRQLLPEPMASVSPHFVGRHPAASTATASMDIHRLETRHIIDAALAPTPLACDDVLM
eukprot:jgi/Botrbrau1/4549/Bobra.60_2s0036.1